MEINEIKNEIKYGHTGEVGKDGLLTTDQHHRLNQIQKDTAEKCMNYLEEMQIGDPFPLAAMATGIGKGKIIHRAIEMQVRNKPDSKILLIAGTKLILNKQTHEALAKYQNAEDNGFEYVESENEEINGAEANGNIEAENPLEGEKMSIMYKTGKLGDLNANVRVATIQAVQSKLNRGELNPQDYDLLIVDEVHNIGTPKRKAVIDQFKRAVGFTATPYRHSGKFKAPDEYGFTVVESLPLPEAQELRLLPPLVGIQIDTKSLVDEIPTTLAGNIDYKKLEKVLKKSPELRPHIADKVAEIIQGKNYKTVIAVNFVWEAQELAELLHKKGIRVGIAVNQQATKDIHTEEIPAEDTIKRYKLPHENDRSIQVLISPYVASEGFDAPATEVLVWASPTDSELRYTQYTGRLARRAEGKRFGVVVDCLYQTNQYNWSYNMGMWMKEDVRQLDNGLLWLGPATDIENLKKLPQVEALTKASDGKSLQDLQKEGLLEIEKTDFPITADSLESIYVGGSGKIKPISEKILAQNPAIKVARRRSGNGIITVIVDEKSQELYRQKMQEAGLKLQDKNILDVQETDFPITTISLRSLYVGGHKKIKPISEKILAQNPAIKVVDRRNGTEIIAVIVGEKSKELYLRKMQEAGLKLQDKNILDVQETDIPITQASLRSIFVGDSEKIKPISEKILAQNPAIKVVDRRNGAEIIAVIVGEKSQELYKQKMQEAGLKLQDKNILDVQKSDFSITGASLRLIFVGKSEKIKLISEKILAENSGIRVVRRRNGSAVVGVISDDKSQQIYKQKMEEAGVRLKDKNILDVQKSDFSITDASFRLIFVGGSGKIKPISEKILAQNPEIKVADKRSGPRVIKALVDEKSKKLYLRKMQEAGIKLRPKEKV